MRSPERGKFNEMLRVMVFATIATVSVLAEAGWSNVEAQTKVKGKTGTVEKDRSLEAYEHYGKILKSAHYQCNEFEVYDIANLAKDYQADGYDADSLIFHIAQTAVQFNISFERVYNGVWKEKTQYYNAYHKVFAETKRRMVEKDSTLADRFASGEHIQLDLGIFNAVKQDVVKEYEKQGAALFVLNQIRLLVTNEKQPLEPSYQGDAAYKLPPKLGRPTKHTGKIAR